MKILFVLSFTLNILIAANISIEKNIWQLVGTDSNVSISSLNLNTQDLIWTYTNNDWYCHKKDINTTSLCNQLSDLKGGDAFWVLSSYDYNLSISDASVNTEKNITSGWNMISPVIADINVSSYFNSDSITSVWTYNNSWKVWTKDGTHTNSNIATLETISINEGAWVNASADFSSSYITFGTKSTNLTNGYFDRVTKSSSDDIEDIWNISFQIDSSVNYSDFEIAVKFTKNSSGAIGEIVYDGLSITDKVVSSPSYILVSGTKLGQNSIDLQIDQNNNVSLYNGVLDNAIALSNNTLTLNLGTIMKTQNSVSESTFKAASDYNLTIVSDKLNIVNSKSTTLSNITTFNYTYTSKDGIEGILEIQ